MTSVLQIIWLSAMKQYNSLLFLTNQRTLIIEWIGISARRYRIIIIEWIGTKEHLLLSGWISLIIDLYRGF